jgi:hypothetical protein
MTNSPFRTGGDAAEQAAATSFGGARYFSLAKPGDRAIIRMLTEQDAWPYVSQHGFMPTKPKPANLKDDAKWPKQMPAICQNDPALAEMPGMGDCYLCKAPQYQGNDKFGKKLSRTAVRVWALCCLREEVKEDGKVVGYRDKLVEIEDKDGTKKRVRDIQVINMSTRNFFGHFSSMYHVYHTVRDRDYLIQRRNEGKDTDYPPVPLDKVIGHEPGSESWAVYDESLKEQDLDLVKIMMERCSMEYYNKFFIPGEGESVPEAEKNGEAAPTPSAEKLSDIKARIKSYQPKSADAANAES